MEINMNEGGCTIDLKVWVIMVYGWKSGCNQRYKKKKKKVSNTKNEQ